MVTHSRVLHRMVQGTNRDTPFTAAASMAGALHSHQHGTAISTTF